MNSALPFVLFAGFGVVVLLVGVLGYLSAKKRREAFAALAAQRGWTYTERDDRWCEAFSGSPFGQGHNRQARNVLGGEFDQRRFTAFDYVYYTTETSTDSQGHTSTHEQSHTYGVVALDCGAAFPSLHVSPEGVFGRMIGRLTNRDIELESEDFNRAFTVTCPDRKLASDVLHPRMMEYLLQHRDSDFRFEGSWLLSTESGQTSIESVEPRLRVIDGVLDNVPEFVWREVRGG
ncbi:MAG: DUF3137 domain-containing protein [Nocardioides sp.]